MLINFLSRYHEADPGDADPQGGSSGKVRASDVLEQFGRDAIRIAEKLADVQSDNHRLREERRNLKQQLTEAQGKAPAADTRVLSADEAKAYDAYAALGKPADIKSALDTKGTAEQELVALKREKALAKAAEAAGYKASVLTTLAGDLDIQVRPVKDGKPLVVVVSGTEETALADWAKENWADFLPALSAQSIQAPDINAGARGNGNNISITDDERKAAQRRYGATF
jgi:hypothetical protein